MTFLNPGGTTPHCQSREVTLALQSPMSGPLSDQSYVGLFNGRTGLEFKVQSSMFKVKTRVETLNLEHYYPSIRKACPFSFSQRLYVTMRSNAYELRQELTARLKTRGDPRVEQLLHRLKNRLGAN